MWERYWKQIVGAAAAVVALLGWFSPFLDTHLEMLEPPERSGAEGLLEPRESIVVADLSVSYGALQNALNDEADKLAGSKSGKSEIKCVSSDFPKFRECLDVNYTVNYQKANAITVGPSGGKVQVRLPASFSGQAGFGGDIAKILSLNKKNFSGSFVVTADALASLDEQYCPKVTPGPVSFQWINSARVQLIGRSSFKILGIGFDVGPWDLDVGQFLTADIEQALKKAMNDARDAIPCEPVRAALGKLWRPHTIPLTSQGQPSAFLYAEPIMLSTSGLLAEPSGLRTVTALKAKLSVQTHKPAEHPLGPLPAHVTAAAQPGFLSLSVPLRVDYDVLRDLLVQELAGKQFETSTPIGKVGVLLKNFDVYASSDGKVALGVGFAADLPIRVLDTEGTIWLSGVPEAHSSGHQLRLTQVAVARSLDNDIWNALSAVFRTQVIAQIEKAAQYDLMPDEQRAYAAIAQALADPSKTGGVRFAVDRPSIRVGRVLVGMSSITVEALVDAGWSANLEEIPR